jgi:hypothetical protein
MAKRSQKEDLFKTFYQAARHALEALEGQYEVSGVVEQLFGSDALDEEAAQQHLRQSRPWETLSDLYDYAVDGANNGEDPTNIVIDGSDVIWLATSENSSPSEEWREIVAMGDGRFALDDGESLEILKVALLAGVDVRTVRNAVSAGDLMTSKQGDNRFVENSSARQWLHGRKGFKPTVHRNELDISDLAEIDSPAAFGAFLADRRERLGISSSLVPLAPFVSSEALEKLEAGYFPLPLDAVFPVADYYQISRPDFLETVMGVFFADELSALRDTQKKGGNS